MTDFPTEPGWYWFYGNRYKTSKLKLTTVEVWGNGRAAVCDNGAFMYEEELGPVRWFKPLEVPDISRLK